MSSDTNRHNIYVILTGPHRGSLVRRGGHATQGYYYVSMVEPTDRNHYTCEHRDNLKVVGCVTDQQWNATGITAELAALAREGVRRTAEHVLSQQEVES
jgi:hypothetical protein